MDCPQETLVCANRRVYVDCLNMLAYVWDGTFKRVTTDQTVQNLIAYGVVKKLDS